MGYRPKNGWTCNIPAKNNDFPIYFSIFTKASWTDQRTDTLFNAIAGSKTTIKKDESLSGISAKV